MEPVPLLDLRPQHARLRDELDLAMREVVDSCAFVLGPVVERFEQDVARYTGAHHAVGCASGTDALVLSLAALGCVSEPLGDPKTALARLEALKAEGDTDGVAEITPGCTMHAWIEKIGEMNVRVA